MESIFELLFELIFDDAIGIARNARISRWARYPVIVFISLFILGIIAGIGAIGVVILIRHEDDALLAAGFLLLILDLVLIISATLKIIAQIKKRKALKGTEFSEKDFVRR